MFAHVIIVLQLTSLPQQVALMPNPPISLGPDVETSLQFYTCTARALLTFMHDDGSTGHMRISDLVLSPHFRDFMVLRHPGATVSHAPPFPTTRHSASAFLSHTNSLATGHCGQLVQCRVFLADFPAVSHARHRPERAVVSRRNVQAAWLHGRDNCAVV